MVLGPRSPAETNEPKERQGPSQATRVGRRRGTATAVLVSIRYCIPIVGIIRLDRIAHLILIVCVVLCVILRHQVCAIAVLVYTIARNRRIDALRKARTATD